MPDAIRQRHFGLRPVGKPARLQSKAGQLRIGFVAGYYGDNESIDLDPKWQEYACE